MNPSQANPLHKQTSAPLLGVWRERMMPERPRSVSQWLTIVVVGAILGIATLGIAAVPRPLAALMLMAVLLPFIAMVLGNVQRLLMAIIILGIPFQLDINFAYRAEVAERSGIGGLSISIVTISIIILYILWFVAFLAKISRDSRRWPWDSTTVALGLYFAFIMLSVLAARDVVLSFYAIFLHLEAFLLYIYVVATVRTRRDVLFIVTMLLISLVLESVVMIGLALVGHSITVAGISARIDAGTRVGGTVGSPNVAASYLTLLLAPAVGVLLTRLGRRYKLLATLAFSLGGLALVFTLSRGGWIAFVVSMTLLCLLAWRRGWLSLTVPVIITLLVLLMAFVFQDTIVNRIVGDDQESAYARLPLIKLAFKIISDHPVLGIGINNFVVAIQQYATPEFSGEWLHVVHNKYLLVWAETGIGGLLAFILFLGATIRKGLRCWKFSDRSLSPLALGFTVAIAGQMIHMFVALFQSRPQLQLLWLTVGLIVAMHNIGRRGTDDTADIPNNRRS